MKTKLIVLVAALAVACIAATGASAVPLSDDLSGYYKFGYSDGNTYAVKAEMGIGALKVHVLPDMRTLYLGIILDDKIYFVDGFNRPRWGVLTQIDDDTALITSHDADTGETTEMTAVRITEEEANRITEENRIRDLNDGCINNLVQISLALHRFAKDHDNELPYSLDELFPNYVTDRSIFVCPVRGGQFTDYEADYEYVPGFRTDSPNPDEEIIINEVSGNHSSPIDGHFVLYLNGRVDFRHD